VDRAAVGSQAVQGGRPPAEKYSVPSVRRTRLLATLALTAALFPWAGGRAGASTTVDKARARLASLEQRIGSEQATLDSLQARLQSDGASLRSLQARLAALVPRLDAAETSFGQTQRRVMQVRTELDAARSSYREVRAQLDAQARQAYMFGPAFGLEAILGATSFSDLSDRVQFLDTVSRTQASLSADVERSATALRAQEGRLSSVLAGRASTLRELGDRRRAVAAAFASQQDLLAADRAQLRQEQSLLGALDRQRRQVDALVTRLATGLSPAELAAARVASAAAAAAHGGRASPMPISFGRWAALLMPRLGAPACTNNLIVVVAWETQEYTQARWNPLATTKDMPGATGFNSTGVKDYRSLRQGLEATRLTLEGGAPSWGYQAVLDSLRSCAAPMVTARAVNASAWCRGCEGGGYVTALVPAVQAFFSSHPH
jgi:peptidoglycan hydrolase CwlO-like protein